MAAAVLTGEEAGRSAWPEGHAEPWTCGFCSAVSLAVRWIDLGGRCGTCAIEARARCLPACRRRKMLQMARRGRDRVDLPAPPATAE